MRKYSRFHLNCCILSTDIAPCTSNVQNLTFLRSSLFPYKRTAFFSGTPNFFGPSYFELALVPKIHASEFDLLSLFFLDLKDLVSASFQSFC